MQFVECPHCGMKILESARICKGCQNPVSNASIIELKSYSSDKSNDFANKISAAGDSKKENDKAAGGLPDISITFDDLVEDGLGTAADDASSLDQIEVVRDYGDESERPENNIKLSKNAKGVTHVNIIEKKEPEGIYSSNFQRNVIPRLIQIFVISVIIIIITVGIVIYNIMDLPQHYNTFHMRKENSKSFSEALIQLNVCENARLNPALNFQVSEIENSFLNSYVIWKVMVSKIERVMDDPLSKNVFVLSVRSDRNSKVFHYIRLYLNDKMSNYLKKKVFIIKEEKSISIHGRIIGWARSSDRSAIEIDIYDAEIMEGL